LDVPRVPRRHNRDESDSLWQAVLVLWRLLTACALVGITLPLAVAGGAPLLVVARQEDAA
jgi:hypothetical protein